MPAPAAAADLKLGREVFEANCAVCHMGGLNNIPGEEKHTLKRDALEKYGLFSQQAIESQVRSGKDAMPPFQGSLSDEEITAVAAFVYSQAAGDLW
ncbi:cytochrome c6 isoform B [Chlorella sorokiniana]|uniref:Cytochrome c-553 n=1 Tax=Chlorella sorokiniana TaxID=3076 RepID=A0A2P6TRE9_CHLSO|nr:cytochrome c6 isoform B [Chlorella sorokiniana]|eukprot:PRW56639.1 cytochrome c6 isoform B [Chlorella sorokiniana]